MINKWFSIIGSLNFEVDVIYELHALRTRQTGNKVIDIR